MGRFGFSDLKIKLISAVELRKAFIDVKDFTGPPLCRKVGSHVTFVVSGVLFAVTARITASKGGH
jgi:uncharacterized membrane protein YqhA